MNEALECCKAKWPHLRWAVNKGLFRSVRGDGQHFAIELVFPNRKRATARLYVGDKLMASVTAPWRNAIDQVSIILGEISDEMRGGDRP